MENPEVSLIIPVYNFEKYIATTLESAFRQDYSNLEIIVVNDGSNDKSQKIISELQHTHSNLRLINQENKGVSVARNTGIDLEELKIISSKFDELIDKLDKKIDNLSQTSNVNTKDIDRTNQIIDEGLHTVLRNLNTSKPTPSAGHMINTEEVPLHVYLSVSKKDFVYNKDNFCQNAVPNILAMLHRQLMMHYTNIFRLSSSIKNINIDYTEISDAFNKLGLGKGSTYVALPIGVAVPKEVESVCEEPLVGFGQSQIIILKKSDLPSVELIDRDKNKPILTPDHSEDSIMLNAELDSKITVPSKLNFLRLIVVNSLFDGRKSELSSIGTVTTYFNSQV